MQDIKSVVVYRLGSLGDTITALPVFNKIVKAFPNADITLLTNKPVMAKAAAVESVLGEDYFFNRTVNYPVGTRNPFLLFKLLIAIRKVKPDIVCYLAGVRNSKNIRRAKLILLRDRMFFRLAGVKKTIGFPKVAEDFSLTLDRHTGDFEWEAYRLARRFSELGKIDLDNECSWDLHFTEREENEAKQIKNDHEIFNQVIILSIGTKWQPNDWGICNWTVLLKKLSEKLTGWHLVVLGASEEAASAELCLSAWRQKGTNLCGKTSPRISALIMRNANVFLGHDSGPMHLAACVGTRCVCVFSARHFPRQWYPRGTSNRIIYHKTDCAGCEKEVCLIQQKKCIMSITTDEVYTAITQVLGIN